MCDGKLALDWDNIQKGFKGFLRVANAVRDVRLMHVDVSDEVLYARRVVSAMDVPMKECTVVRENTVKIVLVMRKMEVVQWKMIVQAKMLWMQK